MSSSETVEEKLQAIAGAVDRLTSHLDGRLDDMEKNIKLKLKDFTEAQSLDLQAKLEDESIAIRNFNRQICLTLQKNIENL